MNWKTIVVIVVLLLGGLIYYLKSTTPENPKETAVGGYVNGLQQDEAKAREAAGLANLNIVKGAVEKYRMEKGSNPASLQDLVPNYMDHVPGNVTYDPSSGTVSVAQ